VARFDRAIPPGGEGTITLKANLAGYKGTVKKTAKVYCNDPQAPSISLALQGTVRALIDLRPTDRVSFQGTAQKTAETVVDLVGGAQPFHITRVDNNVEDKVAHRLETVVDGKHYRLKLTNLFKQGAYNGFLILHTDLDKKKILVIHVNGSIVD
jgi:hypothetical protein